MKYIAIIAAAAAMLLSAGCADTGYGTKQTVGAVTGAAAGGLLGAQFGSGTGQLAATALGAVAGGFLGSEIGRSMDETDRLKAAQAQRAAQTAPIGETITWNNPNNTNRGAVTPVRDGYSSSGQYCREFEHTVVINGRTETAYGVACRQPDGSWAIQS